MIKAVWILLDIGPCLYSYTSEKRFRETDENLFTGFFVALETFAKSIGSDEVLKVELRDLSLWFMKGTNVVLVIASDRDENMSEALQKVGQAFNEIAPNLYSASYNPLISASAKELQDKIDSKIKSIIQQEVAPPIPVNVLGKQFAKVNNAADSPLQKPPPAKAPAIIMETIKKRQETTSEPRKLKSVPQQVKLAGEMIPKLEKPLTDVLRERERLVKRFGVAAVDILHLADGKLTISEIVATSRAEKSTVEDVLSFAQKLGIVEFI